MRAQPSAGLETDITAEPSERFTLETRAKLLDETLKVAHYSSITHFVVAIILAAIFWSDAHRLYLAGLAVAVTLVIGATLYTTWRYRASEEHMGMRVSVSRGVTLARLFAVLLGSIWATMPVMLFGTADPDHRMIVVAVCAGLISDAYVVGPILSVSVMFAVPIIIGSFIALAGSGEPIAISIAALLAVYGVFVLLSVRRMSYLSCQRILDSIRVEDQSQTIGLLLNEFETNTSDWLWQTDRSGRLQHVSDRMAAVIGRDAAALQAQFFSGLLTFRRHPTPAAAPSDISTMEAAGMDAGLNDADAVLHHLAEHTAFHDHVLKVETGSGLRWWKLSGKPVFDGKGDFAGFRGVGSDIHQSRLSEDRIAYLASCDTLTGLANRASFNEQALIECEKADPDTGSTVLLYLDLDGFKLVNDSFGHGVGDRLLTVVGERLLGLIQEDGQVFRLGGDEFAILCSSSRECDAEQLAEQIVTLVSMPYRIDDTRIEIGVSVGIAFAPRDANDPQSLLRRADLALYCAKAEGKGQWRIFNKELENRAIRNSELAADMQAALNRGEMELHYQPLVSLTTGEVVGFEALLRWSSPTFGKVSPLEIIPIAESTGFIVALGRWALKRACSEALNWPDSVRVAVNISSIQFRMATFSEDVEAILDETGLAPDRLEIEITESVFLNENNFVGNNLLRLRELGVRIALDDFGTGYSSLSYLIRFPVDKIKIDRSFVRDVNWRQECIAVIEAIMVIAKSLSIQVTVEGVETCEQADLLRSKDCHNAQGYLYSQALPASELPPLFVSLPKVLNARAAVECAWQTKDHQFRKIAVQ